MKCYFFSPLKALLTINGTPAFMLSKNLKTVSCGIRDLFSVIPSPEFCHAQALAGDDSFDKNVTRFSFFDGVLFIPKFAPSLSFKKELLAASSISCFGYEFLINAHIDGFLRLSVTGYRECTEVFLSVAPTKILAEKRGEYLVVCAKGELNNLLVFSINPLKCLLNVVCQNFELGEALTITRFIKGVTLYKKREHYSLKHSFDLMGTDVSFGKDLKAFRDPLLKAETFFELLSLKGDITPFLSPSLRARAKAIEEFAGDFSFVIPPFDETEPNSFALVGNSIKFGKVFFENGLISDVDIN